MSYGLYGFFLLAGPAGDIATGYQAGQLSLQLLQRFAARELHSKVTFIFNGHIRHWCEPARATIAPFAEGIQSGLETGDLQFVGYNAKDLCTHLFFMGEPLEEVARQQVKYIDLLRRLQQEHSTYYIQIWHQAVLNLKGSSVDPRRLGGSSFDAEVMLPELERTNNRNLLYITHLAETMLSYLFADYEGAIARAEQALLYEESSAGLMNVGMHTLFHALALLAHYPQAGPEARTAYLARVLCNLRQMRRWAPANYQHGCELVEAETARVLNHTAEAMALYDQSIASAIRHGYTSIEALANERAGLFYLALGREKIGQMYLRAAHHAYLRWGAGAKANDLVARHPALLTSPAPRPRRRPAGSCRARVGSSIPWIC